MKTNVAAQIAGITVCRNDEPSDHPITTEEHAMAIEVGYEIASQHGIDLAAHVSAQHAAELAYFSNK